MYECVDRHTYMHALAWCYACIHTYMYACMYVYMYVCVVLSVICMYMCIHAHARTHTHKHTHVKLKLRIIRAGEPRAIGWGFLGLYASTIYACMHTY